MRKYFYLPLIVLLFFSCRNSQKQADKDSTTKEDTTFVFTTPKVIDLESIFNKHFSVSTNSEGHIKLERFDSTGLIKLSDIAADVEYVLLKTKNDKEELYIRKSQNLFITKDYIFVHGMTQIVQYDRLGNLIRTIGRQGGGPGEFNYVYEMTFNEELKRIHINTSGKINEYDFEGNFIRAIRTKYDNKMILLDADHIAVEVPNYWHDVAERLVVLNEKGEVVRRYPRHHLFEHVGSVTTNSAYDPPRLTRFKDIVCFNERYNDTIYEVHEDDLKMRYFLDWGEYARKPEIFYKEEFKDKRAKTCEARFYESERYVLMPAYAMIRGTYVYDKYTDRTMLAYPYDNAQKSDEIYTHYSKILHENGRSFINDVDGGLNFAIDNISEDNKYVMCFYHASDVKELLEETGYREDILFPEKQEKLKALIDSIDEDEHNYFVMLVKLKE